MKSQRDRGKYLSTLSIIGLEGVVDSVFRQSVSAHTLQSCMSLKFNNCDNSFCSSDWASTAINNNFSYLLNKHIDIYEFRKVVNTHKLILLNRNITITCVIYMYILYFLKLIYLEWGPRSCYERSQWLLKLLFGLTRHG